MIDLACYCSKYNKPFRCAQRQKSHHPNLSESKAVIKTEAGHRDLTSDIYSLSLVLTLSP